MDYKIRTMTIDDYDAVYALWLSISGFAMRSIDDSRAGVEKFLKRNPSTSVVAESASGEIIGSILVGNDGRHGCFYHVCVREDCRMHGVGKAMATAAMRRLQAEGINKIQLVAFTRNAAGNGFWNAEGWKLRPDLNTYEFVLNDENIIRFNQ